MSQGEDRFPLDHRCVHAIWALAARGDKKAIAAKEHRIEELYAFAVLVVDGQDKSAFAKRVLAEAIAHRMEHG